MINDIKSALHSQDKKRLISNFLSLSFIQGANYLVPLLILPYIVRIIGPEKFGLLTYAQNFIYYFTIIINYSFDYSATREVSLHRNDKKKLSEIFSSVLFCKLILLGSATFIFLTTLFFVDQFSRNWQIYVLTYLINIGFVLFPSWFFQGIEKMSKTALFNFITKIFFAAMVVLLIHRQEQFYMYALSTSLAQILVGCTSFIYVFYYYKLYIFNPDFKNILQTLKQGLPIFFSNIAISLYTTTSLMILGFFSSEIEYGYFSAALKISLVVQSLVILPLGLTLFPHIGKSIQQSTELGIVMISKYLRIISVITLFLSAFVCLFAKQLIVLLFGAEFIEATLYLKIMSFLPFVSGLNNLISVQGLLNLKRDKQFLMITFITFGFSLILSFLFVPKYKGIATAGIILISEICMTSIASYYLFAAKYRETSSF